MFEDFNYRLKQSLVDVNKDIFALHYQFSRFKFSSIWTDTEFKSYLFFTFSIVSVLVLILFFQGIYIDLFICVRDVLFTTIALITGTGFATVDYEQWPVACQAILFCLFFTGGCAGSTTGGIKVIRLVIFCKFAYQQINQLIHPKAILNLKVNRQMVKDNVIKGVLGFFILYALSFMVGTVLMASTGLDLVSASAATATCVYLSRAACPRIYPIWIKPEVTIMVTNTIKA